MNNYLNNLLKQPESIRRFVAYFATAIIGVVLISAWFLISSYNMSQTINPEIKTDQTANNFRKNLPELRQTDSVMTELNKQQAAKINDFE